MGTVNEKVSESDFVPLWDGTIKRRSHQIKTPRFMAAFEGVMVDEPNWKVKL